MKAISKASWILFLGLALLFPVSGVAGDRGKNASNPENGKIQENRPQVHTRSATPAAQGQSPEDNKKDGDLGKPSTMPIYKPPLRGSPAGRVAGGTRGTRAELPYLCLLVPDHVGLTTQAQPLLYYFISHPTQCPMEFTLIESNGVYPLVETRIGSPKEPGVHVIRLAGYNINLEKNKKYRWFIALVPDDQHRSKDLLASGAIELIALQDGLKKALQGAPEREAPYLYAEAGIWYDALSAVSTLLERSPGNSEFRKERASLLEQVGLTRAAQYEMRVGKISDE